MSDEKPASSPLYALAASILLAGLSASLSYWSSAKADREKSLLEQRKEAYVGYVSALDKARVSRMNLKCEPAKDSLCRLQIEFELEAGASARRIGIYGDPRVVHATAEYYRKIGRTTATPCDPATWKYDLDMYIEMRRTVLGEQGVSDRDLAELLLPCSIP